MVWYGMVVEEDTGEMNDDATENGAAQKATHMLLQSRTYVSHGLDNGHTPPHSQSRTLMP